MRAKMIPAGTRFGSLTTTGHHESKHGMLCWECDCECGRRTVVNGTHLRSGSTVACGCGRNRSRLTHGEARRTGRSRLYVIWNGMRLRCTKPSSNSYRYYGARGISVCEAWSSFEQFAKDMGPIPSPKHSIDRINNDGNYEPGNCRWATWSEQNRNKRGGVANA